MINDPKLRALAEAALVDSEPLWTYVDGPLLGDVHVQTRPENPGRSQIRVDPGAVGPFIAAASPGVVIELIDSLERSRSAARNIADQAADIAVECAQLKIALALMTEARDTACAIIENAFGDDAWHAAHVAELRKVGA